MVTLDTIVLGLMFMIRFKTKFEVYDSPRVKIPREKHYNENFWCSFNTKRQLIMCSIIYLGEDESMRQKKCYDGIVELPYGEKFPPYCINFDPELSEQIDLDEYYYLNVGGEMIGVCKLLEVIEIVRDKFDITIG